MQEKSYLQVTITGSGVLIHPVIAEGTADDVYLVGGETWGGRTFEEWRAVALGAGQVDAEWLRV